MKKIILLLISLVVATPVLAQENNWEASPFTQENNQPNPQLKENQTKSRHNISVEYGFLNITDLGWAIASLVSGIFGDDENETLFLGDISINYGYEVGELFETGIIANFALPGKGYFFATVMPRAKLNFNQGEFVNPYMELDAGIGICSNGRAAPMFHGTLLGLEIGYFYMQLAGWGQRGLFYAGVKIPL